MNTLAKTGKYTVDSGVKAKIDESFAGLFCDEQNCAATIRKYFEKYDYLADTHTAVALYCAKEYAKKSGQNRKIIVASTASPYKFATDVYKSITGKSAASDTAALDVLRDLSGVEIPYPLRNITERKVIFAKTVDKNQMLEEVYRFV